MAAGYIGKQATNNVFRKPGIWHSKEQYYHKKNETWDPEYDPGKIRNAMYVRGVNTDEGRLSNLSYGGIFQDLNVNAVETSSRGIFIGDNGKKVYIIGTDQDVIIQFEMDIAYDVSSIDVLNTKTRFIRDVSTDPTDIQWKPDGTKMWVLDNVFDSVVEFDVDEAWNVLTAMPNSNAFNFNAENENVTSVGFKTDGTKMYMLSAGTDSVYQYSLGTAWDVSTASYDSVSTSVSDEDDPRGLDFSHDGSKFYIIGTQDDLIRQYDMSSNWDISTATHTNGKSHSVTSIESAPRGFSFHPDNSTKFYLIGDSDRIYEFNSPSGIASFSSYSGKNYEMGTKYDSPLGMDFQYGGDGTRWWTVDAQGRFVHEWNCVEPWNVNHSFRTGTTLDLVTYDQSPRDIGFKTDGTSLYFTGSQHNFFYQLNLTIPWDITSVVGAAVSLTGLDDGIEGFDWKPDGTRFFITGTQADRIYQYDCSSAWDISTGVQNGSVYTPDYWGNDPRGIAFNEDGSRVLVTDTQQDYISELVLSTPWDVSSTVTRGNRVYARDASPLGVNYGNDYKRVYVIGDQSNRVRMFDLVTNKVFTDKEARG